MNFASATRRAALALTAAMLIAGPAMAQAPAAYDGVWAGALSAGGQTLHLELTLKTAGGETTGELNSRDQDTVIPVTGVKTDGGELSVLFLAVGGELKAKLSPDGKTLSGTWNQGATFPLTLTKK
jgi:hypothetical protein